MSAEDKVGAVEDVELGEVKEAKLTKFKVPKPEKYYRVRFHNKSSPTDADDVQLSVNGEPIVIERGKETIIRERYKICADNAAYPTFTQSPGHNRKVTGEIHVFPYDLIGDATEDEYKKLLREGNKATREAAKKDVARSDG